MAKVIMVQGTMSNAGKSLLVAGLCRIMKQDGYRVAPFKSQNMALNSFITEDGLEMGRAQVMQAEAAGIKPSVYMNPILLKPTNDVGSQVIVNGKVIGNMPAREYFQYKKKLIPDIREAFHELSKIADIIVIEGAGSPAEINLKQNDIVNMGLAEIVDAPVLLVGDIDRGGVFAQLLGTLMLLEDSERERVKGLIINKFRGDKSILDPGIDMLEEKGGIPVTGVLPYMQVRVDDEDSLSERLVSTERGAVNIGVVRLPRISNFTDFNAFEQIDGVKVIYVDSPSKIEDLDLVIIPGSKNTIGDLKWLRESGMEARIKRYALTHPVIGICGGYQMLGMSIEDPEGVEEGGSIHGMELLPVITVLKASKNTTQVSGNFGEVKGLFEALSEEAYQGYEIHMGETEIAENAEITEIAEKNKNDANHGINEKSSIYAENRDDKNAENAEIAESTAEITEKIQSFTENGFSCGNVYGSYVHGLFDHGNIAFMIAEALARHKGVELKQQTKEDYEAFKEKQYDILASEIRKHMDMDAVYAMLRESLIQ